VVESAPTAKDAYEKAKEREVGKIVYLPWQMDDMYQAERCVSCSCCLFFCTVVVVYDYDDDADEEASGRPRL